MREGKPSPRFGARRLHNIYLGSANTPLLIKLYDERDNVIATLTEERGECIDPGYVDFFLGANCRPAQHNWYLVEKLADGTTGILHDNPKALAGDFPAWVAFLDKWVSRHEHSHKDEAFYRVHLEMEDGAEFKWEGFAEDASHASGLAGAEACHKTGQQIMNQDRLFSTDTKAVDLAIERFTQNGVNFKPLAGHFAGGDVQSFLAAANRELRDVIDTSSGNRPAIFIKAGENNLFIFPDGETFQNTGDDGEILRGLLKEPHGVENWLREARTQHEATSTGMSPG